MGFTDWLWDRLVIPAFGILAVLLLFVVVPVLGYGMYKSATSPTFTLTKSAWVCTTDHPESTTAYVMTGKVLVPVTSTSRVCDIYKRKP